MMLLEKDLRRVRKWGGAPEGLWGAGAGRPHRRLGLQGSGQGPWQGTSARDQGAFGKVEAPESLPKWLCGSRQGTSQETRTAGMGLREGLWEEGAGHWQLSCSWRGGDSEGL